MSEVTNDESRLRATEAQMRRALGLQDGSSPRPQPNHSAPVFNGSHRPPHRFVRDGEVPVVHLDHHPHGEPSGNQLEAARQTIRSLTAARELAERSLAQAETRIRDLRTKLAHERLARDEAVTRVGTERQTAEQAQTELVAERAARRQAEARFAQILECRPEAEGRLGHVVTAQEGQQPSQAASRGRPGRKVGKAGATAAPSAAIDAEPEGTDEDGTTVRKTVREPKTNDVAQPTQARRRGRPPKINQPEAEFVEWWKPGWKEQFR
jgi:hypothetical protein